MFQVMGSLVKSVQVVLFCTSEFSACKSAKISLEELSNFPFIGLCCETGSSDQDSRDL